MLTAFVGLAFLSAAVLAQEITIDIISLSKCPVGAGGKEENFNMSFDLASKTFSMNMDLSKEVNEECTYKVNNAVLTFGKYVDYMDGSGNVCEVLTTTLKSAWEGFKSTMNPTLKEVCTIKPGKHDMKGYAISMAEIDVPFPDAGQFKTETHMFCDNVEIGCLRVEYNLIADD